MKLARSCVMPVRQPLSRGFLPASSRYSLVGGGVFVVRLSPGIS